MELPTKSLLLGEAYFQIFIVTATKHIRLLWNTSQLTLESVLVADCLMKDFMMVLRPRDPGVIISIWFFCTVCTNERMCGAILYRDKWTHNGLSGLVQDLLIKSQRNHSKSFLRMQTNNQHVEFCGKLFILTRLLWLYNGFTLGDGSIMMVRDAPTVRHFFGGDCFFLGVLISWAAWRFEPERVGLKEKHKDY